VRQWAKRINRQTYYPPVIDCGNVDPFRDEVEKSEWRQPTAIMDGGVGGDDFEYTRDGSSSVHASSTVEQGDDGDGPIAMDTTDGSSRWCSGWPDAGRLAAGGSGGG
jgi:hypothetical protein